MYRKQRGVGTKLLSEIFRNFHSSKIIRNLVGHVIHTRQMKVCTISLSENVNGADNLGDLRAGDRIILQEVLGRTNSPPFL
jgi:hypothetical protein